MGTFRTVTATLPCLKCGTPHGFGIQFKTDDDSAMRQYDLDDLADDIAPGVYEGIADSFCPRCLSHWVEDEKRAHFDSLADEVEAVLVTARRATWRHGALYGLPELGLVVTVGDEPPLAPAQIRTFADLSDVGGWPNFGARLAEVQIALWAGSARITPGPPESDAAHASWWRPHQAAVTARLRAKGWPAGDEQFRDVSLEVTPDQRFRIL